VFVKKLKDCESLIANDGCIMRELLHPANDPVDLPYSIAIATVEQNQQSYAHKLEQDEVYYILQGEGCMYINDENNFVSSGDIIVIPANSSQWIENKGENELVFAAIVSPPWTKDGDVRI
jgi:mannose-6-phosphate isomerase-like protein (cupin superfamily)